MSAVIARPAVFALSAMIVAIATGPRIQAGDQSGTTIAIAGHRVSITAGPPPGELQVVILNARGEGTLAVAATDSEQLAGYSMGSGDQVLLFHPDYELKPLAMEGARPEEVSLRKAEARSTLHLTGAESHPVTLLYLLYGYGSDKTAVARLLQRRTSLPASLQLAHPDGVTIRVLADVTPTRLAWPTYGKVEPGETYNIRAEELALLPITGSGAQIPWSDRTLYPVLDLGRAVSEGVPADRINAIRWQQGIHRPVPVDTPKGLAIRLARAPWHVFSWGPGGSAYAFVGIDTPEILLSTKEQEIPKSLVPPDSISLGQDCWLLPGMLDIDSAALAMDRISRFGGEFALRCSNLAAGGSLPASESLTLISPRFGLLYAAREPCAVFHRPPGQILLRTARGGTAEVHIVATVEGSLTMGRDDSRFRALVPESGEVHVGLPFGQYVATWSLRRSDGLSVEGHALVSITPDSPETTLVLAAE